MSKIVILAGYFNRTLAGFKTLLAGFWTSLFEFKTSLAGSVTTLAGFKTTLLVVCTSYRRCLVSSQELLAVYQTWSICDITSFVFGGILDIIGWFRHIIGQRKYMALWLSICRLPSKYDVLNLANWNCRYFGHEKIVFDDVWNSASDVWNSTNDVCNPANVFNHATVVWYPANDVWNPDRMSNIQPSVVGCILHLLWTMSGIQPIVVGWIWDMGCLEFSLGGLDLLIRDFLSSQVSGRVTMLFQVSTHGRQLFSIGKMSASRGPIW